MGLDPKLLFLQTLLQAEVSFSFASFLPVKCAVFVDCLLCNEPFYVIMHNDKSTGALSKFLPF